MVALLCYLRQAAEAKCALLPPGAPNNIVGPVVLHSGSFLEAAVPMLPRIVPY